MVFKYCIFILCLGLLLQTAEAPIENHHPGTIIDAVEWIGIEAHAYAYGTREKIPNDDRCPIYKDEIDHEVSKRDGTFTFHIDSSRRYYYATFCKPGYAFLSRVHNENQPDGLRVLPDPVPLYPLEEELLIRRIDRVEAAYRAIKRQITTFQMNMDYFSRADEEGFYGALKKLPEVESDAIMLLMKSSLSIDRRVSQ